MLPKIEVCGQSTKCARSLLYVRVFPMSLKVSKSNVIKIDWKWVFELFFKLFSKLNE